MRVLGTFESVHLAEDLRGRLLKCGIKTEVEGRNAASAGVYIPGSIKLVLVDERQSEVAMALIRQLDGSNVGSRPSLWAGIKAAGADRLVVGVVTVALALALWWLLGSVL